MSTVQYNWKDFKDYYIERLAIEHLRIDQLARANAELIAYEPIERSKIFPHPPVVYKIVYKINSIIGIDENKSPKYGGEHELKLRLPTNFPEQPAECTMVSEVWHPNIRFYGAFKGAICTNHKGFGSLFYLDELIIRIGEFIQYKRYLAEDRPPYPEDRKVARWVKSFGEPQGIINKEKGIFTDDRIWKAWEEVTETEVDQIIVEEKTSENPPDEDHKEDDQNNQDEKNEDDDDISIVELD